MPQPYRQTANTLSSTLCRSDPWLLVSIGNNCLLQVARIRYEQSSALLAEEQKELSEQEEQQLEALQQKRLADLVVRQCTTVLKSVLAHKVCHCLPLHPTGLLSAVSTQQRHSKLCVPCTAAQLVLQHARDAAGMQLQAVHLGLCVVKVPMKGSCCMLLSTQGYCDLAQPTQLQTSRSR